MSAKEEERLRDMLRKVTGAWNKCEVRYEESQRLLYDAREELKTAQAVADGLQWKVDELCELCADMWVELHCKGAGFDVHQAADEFFERMQELGVEVE